MFDMPEKLLKLDPDSEIQRICEKLREDVHQGFRRRGAIVGLSGGVDSAVVLALCVTTQFSGSTLPNIYLAIFTNW